MTRTAKERRARKLALSDRDRVIYREMERYCPKKVKQTTRQPVPALEYQKWLKQQGKEEEKHG